LQIEILLALVLVLVLGCFLGFDCEDEVEANKRKKKRSRRGFSQPGSAGVPPAFSLGSINSPPGRRRSQDCAPAFP
jgi:hypothetical protein